MHSLHSALLRPGRQCHTPEEPSLARPKSGTSCPTIERTNSVMRSGGLLQPLAGRGTRDWAAILLEGRRNRILHNGL